MGLFVIIVGVIFGALPLYRGLFGANHQTPGLGYYALKLFAFVAALVLFGVWLLLGVVRSKYYLLTKTFNGTKKIVFQDSNNIAGIRDYVAKARTQFGYEIKVST
jgi:hypothetical protein